MNRNLLVRLARPLREVPNALDAEASCIRVTPQTPVWCGSNGAGTDAIQRTSQAGSEQRLGGAYRWESPWPPENRELAGSDHIALPKAYFDSLGLPATVVRS
jgi:hypothetical protein